MASAKVVKPLPPKPVVGEETKLMKISDLRLLRVRCEAVTAVGVGDYKTDYKIKRLGARAKTFFEELVGVELDLLKGRVEKVDKRYEKKKEEMQSDSEFIELVKQERDLYKREVEFTFQPVEVDFLEFTPDDLKQTITVSFRDGHQPVGAYAAFNDLEELGFLTIINLE